MKKTKRQASAKYLPLTDAQIAAITLAWHQLLDAHLPTDVTWLSAPFEKEAGAWYLRAFLDTSDKNITLDQCAAFTRLLDDKLDSLPIPAECAYHLEISSPGLFRQLTTPKELAFYQGEPVRAVREGHAPIDGTLGPLDESTQHLGLTPVDATEPVQLPWGPDLQITLNYKLTELTELSPDVEDAADD